MLDKDEVCKGSGNIEFNESPPVNFIILCYISIESAAGLALFHYHLLRPAAFKLWAYLLDLIRILRP